jgi:hypothetical protein
MSFDKSDVAIVVSCLSFAWGIGWSIFTWRRQQGVQDRERRDRLNQRDEDRREREEQTKEKVTGKSTCRCDSSGSTVVLTVFNCGGVPVNIERVLLQWQGEGSAFQNQFEMVAPTGEMMRSPLVGPVLSTKHELAPRKSVEFHVPRNLWQLKELAAPRNASKVWLTVETYAGEIWRDDSEQVKHYFETAWTQNDQTTEIRGRRHRQRPV